MIQYQTSGLNFLWNVFKTEGSVFPKALYMSIPNTIVTCLLVYFVYEEQVVPFAALATEDSVMKNNAIWGGFSFLVGFLVVFRTSQAYSRFWEGCTNMHKMGAEWFDACSALVAFSRHATVPQEHVMRFQNTLVRLFSMLHAAALGEIEECGEGENYEQIEAFSMEIIDAEVISDDSLMAVRDSEAKVELIFQWVQQLVVENIKTGVLSIPPPILSRSFQEIANGMVHFHDALKISNVPFPFPYAQTCDCLLLMHYVLVPFIVCPWVRNVLWAGAFCFVQVFTFWTLNFIAAELENPFGSDDNDIDGAQMQRELNSCLRLLLRASTQKTPTLKMNDDKDQRLLVRRAIGETACPKTTFKKRWEDLEPNVPASSRSLHRKKYSAVDRISSFNRPFEPVNSEVSNSTTMSIAIPMDSLHHHQQQQEQQQQQHLDDRDAESVQVTEDSTCSEAPRHPPASPTPQTSPTRLQTAPIVVGTTPERDLGSPVVFTISGGGYNGSRDLPPGAPGDPSQVPKQGEVEANVIGRDGVLDDGTAKIGTVSTVQQRLLEIFEQIDDGTVPLADSIEGRKRQGNGDGPQEVIPIPLCESHSPLRDGADGQFPAQPPRTYSRTGQVEVKGSY